MQPIDGTPLPVEYLRIKEAAKFIGMSSAFLRKVAREGHGPERVRCGKVLLYPIVGLRRYMAERVEYRKVA
jgi:predicted DNA-binding transcriptional regulator AlpA